MAAAKAKTASQGTGSNEVELVKIKSSLGHPTIVSLTKEQVESLPPGNRTDRIVFVPKHVQMSEDEGEGITPIPKSLWDLLLDDRRLATKVKGSTATLLQVPE